MVSPIQHLVEHIGPDGALVHKSLSGHFGEDVTIRGGRSCLRKHVPYKANEARRHKFPKARYKVNNWREYDKALRERGSLTLWITPEALATWHPPITGARGRSRHYSDVAIETGHMLRLAFARPWRQTEGL